MQLTKGVSHCQRMSLAVLASVMLLFAPHVEATKQLYTNSVAYCSAPVAIQINDLSLQFYPSNNTLQFSITAASIQDDLNVSLALNVNAYGRDLFNVEIDLCDFAGDILCPLPQYTFSGSGIFPVPASIASKIPSIAFTVPDLEAVATIELTDTSDSQVVGCVQLSLSNGKTAKHAAVKWAVVGLALLALFSSLLHTVIAQSTGAAQWRIVDVMLAIQLPAITSLLSLDLPVVFSMYGTNFAWAIGLVNIPSLQTSITKTRSNTGGNDQAIFGQDLIAQVATRLNPLLTSSTGATSELTTPNIPTKITGSLQSLLSRDLFSTRYYLSELFNLDASSFTFTSLRNTANAAFLQARAQYAPNTGPGGTLLVGGNFTLPVVYADPSNHGGLASFAERVNVAPRNAFLTVLVSIFILLAVVIGALLLVLAIAFLARLITSRKTSDDKEGKVNHQVTHWSRRVSSPSDFIGTTTYATMGRFLLVIFPVFFIFAFYQWDYSDSWVPDLVAGIFTVILLAAIVALFFPMIRTARREGASNLYYNDTPPARGGRAAKTWGQMAHMYRPRFYWFSTLLPVYFIIQACFVSFAQGHGTRQAIGLLVLEVLLFLTLCIFRVGRDKKSDFVFIVLCFSRVATWAICIVFIPSANVIQIPRVVVGFVLLAVTALAIVFVFLVTVVDLLTPFLKRNRRAVQHPTGLDGEKVVYVADTFTPTEDEEEEEYPHPRAVGPPLTDSTPSTDDNYQHHSFQQQYQQYDESMMPPTQMVQQQHT